MAPLQVSIVCSGRKTAAGNAFYYRKTEYWFHVPLYNKLTDRVSDEQIHHKSADDFQTIIAIYGQDGFPEVCIEFVQEFCEQAADGTPLVDAQCNKGEHRAPTFARTAAEMLNALEDNNGRMYNAQVFSLQWYTRWDAINTHIESAVGWANRFEPHIMPGGAGRARDRTLLFGYGATAQRKAAEVNFEKIWRWVDGINADKRENCRAASSVAKSASSDHGLARERRSRSRSLAPLPRKAAPASKLLSRSEAAKASAATAPAPPIMPPAPFSPNFPPPVPPFMAPPPFPPAASVPLLVFPTFVPGMISPPAAFPNLFVRPLATGMVRPGPWPKAAAAPVPGSWVPPCGSDWPPPATLADTELPWVNIRNDTDMAACWLEVLREKGVDRTAQMGLFGLAQSGPKGRSAALGIMAKLLKKEADAHHVQKPSAFVWKCVKNHWDNSDWK